MREEEAAAAARVSACERCVKACVPEVLEAERARLDRHRAEQARRQDQVRCVGPRRRSCNLT